LIVTTEMCSEHFTNSLNQLQVSISEYI